jgi:mono/diheme cytochrome c family protein
MSAPYPGGLIGDVSAGRAFFNDNCAECHGEAGNGQGRRAYFMNPKPADLTSAKPRAELNRPSLAAAISMGVQRTGMPAWSKVLSPKQIANVAEYVFQTFIRPGDGKTASPPAVRWDGLSGEEDKKKVPR